MINEMVKDRYLMMLKTALGPVILELLEDKDVIEVMLNPDGQLLVDKIGQGKSSLGHNMPVEQGTNIIKLVASYKNQVADADSPMVATELPLHAARFQGWLPPVVSGPCFSIRKRAVAVFSLDDYVAKGLISLLHADFLKASIDGHKNIMVVGGTSSGKTTFANALLGELYQTKQRVLVLEDLPELQLLAEDVVTMETTPSVSMRDLVKGALRMRPDRIIIGEVRDGAALELLKAWNTGHPGGVCTLHANSVQSAPNRLEDLIQEVVEVVPKNLITEAVDVVVYLERDDDHLRKVKEVAKLKQYCDGAYQFEFIES